MFKSRFSVRFKHYFPQEVWSWIYLALKHDALVWDSLENTGLGEQALEAFPASPAVWTPANLAALAVLGSLPAPALNEQPLQQLEEKSYARAIQAGRDWEHSTQADLDFKKAGLVALYCRELWRKDHSYEDVGERFLGKESKNETILGILYGLVPEPVELLRAILKHPEVDPRVPAVVHAVFCNPMPAEAQLDVLRKLLDSLKLATGVQLLRITDHYRPWLSRILAAEFLEKVKGEFPEFLRDETPEQQCEKIRDILHLSELQTLSGQTGRAVNGLNRTMSAARELQGKIAARYASTVTASASQTGMAALPQQLQSVVLSAWKHATQLAPENPDHQSGLVKALISAGLPEQAQEYIAQLPVQPGLDSAPGVLVASASLEDHFGNTSHACELAQQAVASIQAGNAIELEDVLVLTRLLNKLGIPELVVHSAQAALQCYPANAELLQLSAQSLLLKEKPEQAILNLYSILASDDPSPTGQDQQDRSEMLQRLVIDSLERMGDWDAALSERSELMGRYETPLVKDWHGLANCALRAGQTEMANEACRKALEVDENDPVAYLLMGETSLALGDLAEAIQRFQKSVHLAPAMPAAWLTLAKTYRLTGEQGQMIQTLRSASLALPDSPEIQLALGEIYLEQEEPTLALPSLRRAASLAITPQIALRLGQTLLKLGHLDEARKVIERALKTGGPDTQSQGLLLPETGLSEQQAELNLVYARTLRAQGEPAAALPIYEKVIRSYPGRLEPRLEMAKTWVESGGNEAAIDRSIDLLREILEEAEGASNSQADEPSLINETRLLLAEGLAQKGNFAESLTFYRQVLDPSGKYRPNELTRIAAGFASVALALDEPEQALALLEEASRGDPRNPQLLKLQAEAYRANGLVEESFAAARMVLELTPSDLENLVWFIEQAGSLQGMAGAKKIPVSVEVARALEYATQLAPTRADLLLRLGKALEDSGDRFAAAEVYRRLASLDGQEFPIPLKDLVAAALALRNIGDAQVSVTLLERILAQVESSEDRLRQADLHTKADILRELSRSQSLAGDLPAAIQSLDMAIAEAADVELFLTKANLLENMGEPAAALAVLEKALQLEPHRLKLITRLASILKKSGRHCEALSYAERAVQLAGQQGELEEQHTVRMLAAELAYTLLLQQQAWEFLHADLAGDHESCDHLEHAFLRAEMGLDAREAELAREELGRLVESSSNESSFVVSRFRADQSRLAYLRSEFEQAASLFSEALQLLEDGALKKDAASPVNFPDEQIASLRAVSRAALDLGKWDTATNIARRLTILAPHEPISHLHLVQVIVRRAEAQLLSQDLEIRKNSNGAQALSDESRGEFQTAIESAVYCSKGAEPGAAEGLNPLADKSLPHPVRLWYARGLAVFDPSPSSAFLLANELREAASRPDELAALLSLFRRLGENSSVIKAVENFEKKEPASNRLTSHPIVQIQVALAREEAEPQQAITILQEALSGMSGDDPLEWPSAPMLNYLCARIAAAAEQWSVAQASIQDALLSWPDEARWHARAATIFMAEDPEGDLPDLSRAIEHLECCIRHEPDNELPYRKLGQIYLDREEYASANQMLEKAVQLSPENGQAWQLLARAQLRSGQLDAAARSAESAQRIDQDSLAARLLLAEIALQANNPRGAVKRLQAILEAHPENVHALYLLALSLQALDRNEQAMTAIEKALQLEDNPQDLLIEKIKLVRKLEGFEPGLSFLQEQIKKHPRNIQLVVMLSDWLFEAGNHQSAVQVAQAVLQSNHYRLTPRQVSELHFRTGYQMRRAGQLDQALHHLNKSIEHSPGYLEAYLELGRAYQDQRAYPQALKIFQKAITVAPNDYRPYYFAGQALKEDKDFAKSEAMLRKAAQLAPDEVGVHRLLGAVVVLNLVHSRRIPTDETKMP